MEGLRWHILLTTAFTLLSGAVAVQAYRTLAHESAQAATGTSFAQGKSTYIIRDRNDPGRCIGEGHVLLDYSHNQVSLDVDGWAALRLNDTSSPVSLRGSASFNSLGQLTAMVFYTSIGDHKFKLGSTQINPIKVEVYRDTPESPLILRQLFPGPVILKPSGKLFELSVPHLSSIREHTSGLTPPLLIEATNAPAACDIATAGSLDLSPLVGAAGSLAHTIEKSFGVSQ